MLKNHCETEKNRELLECFDNMIKLNTDGTADLLFCLFSKEYENKSVSSEMKTTHC